MQKRALTRRSFLGLSAAAAAGLALTGCEGERADGKAEVEIVNYKMEAASYFEDLEAQFNEQSDDVFLNFDSPNDAVTIMKTRFVRDDYPPRSLPSAATPPTRTLLTLKCSPTSPTIRAWPTCLPPTRRS